MNRFSHATSKWGAGAEERLSNGTGTFPRSAQARAGKWASSLWPSCRPTWPRHTWTSPWHVPERSLSPGPTMSTNHLRQRLRHIATQWPADPLRPKLQLKTFFAALAEHPALSPTAVAATNALHQNRVSGHVSELRSSVFTAVNHHLEIFRSLFRKRC